MVMEFGYVQKIDYVTYKCYVKVLKGKYESSDDPYYFDFFNYRSRAKVEEFRLVVFELGDEEYLLHNVHDLDINLHKELFGQLVEHRYWQAYYLCFINANPLLVDYYFENSNNIYYRKLMSALKNEDYFNLDILMRRYKIDIDESHIFRGSGTDTITIAIKSKDDFIDGDEYIRSIFPKVVKNIFYDNGVEHWTSLLDSGWKSLGGNVAKEKYKQQGKRLETYIKNKAQTKYCPTAHRSYIQNEFQLEYNRLRSHINKSKGN